MAILFISGVRDDGRLRVFPDAGGQAQFATDGSCNVLSRINLGQIQPMQFLLYGPESKSQPVKLPEKPTLIFNQISDADTHVASLERCVEICNGIGVPVINHPSAILETTRDKVAEKLQGIEGLHTPGTIRCTADSPADILRIIESENLDFPVIQRIAGHHNAKSMVLIEGPGDIEKLHVFPFDDTVFYLTEFVDYRDSSGIYNKHRIIFVDGKPVPRHTYFDETWKVNSSCVNFVDAHPGLPGFRARYETLRDHLFPPTTEIFNEINHRLGLDYLGIDCHIRPDGSVILFEANANMNTLRPRPSPVEEPLEILEKSLVEMIRKRSGEGLG